MERLISCVVCGLTARKGSREGSVFNLFILKPELERGLRETYSLNIKIRERQESSERLSRVRVE